MLEMSLEPYRFTRPPISTTIQKYITVLLDNGSDGTAVDGLLRTPFDLAQDNGALAGTDAYWALSDARYK